MGWNKPGNSGEIAGAREGGLLKSRPIEWFTYQDRVRVRGAHRHRVPLWYVDAPTQTGRDGKHPGVDLTSSEETSLRDAPNSAKRTAGDAIHSKHCRICVSRVSSHKNERNRSEDKKGVEFRSQSLTQRGWAQPRRRGTIPSRIHTKIHTQTGGSTAHLVWV